MHGGVDMATGSDVSARRKNPTRTDSIKPSRPPTLGRAGLRSCPPDSGHPATAGFAEMRPLLTHKRRIPSASQIGRVSDQRALQAAAGGNATCRDERLPSPGATLRKQRYEAIDRRAPASGFAVRAQADCDGA
jgi:hypothetical protein